MSGTEIEPGVRLSGHLISEQIGAGGFSKVFRAVPDAGGPAVAVKVAVRPELAQALKAEGSVLRRLSSPRFVKILEEHFDADPPFFVLELCEGGDLRAVLEASPGKRLAPERALDLARGILEGIAFAHEEGLVHGDLKPENVLLDAAGEPKIADLGLSRARRQELLARKNQLEASIATEAGKVRGTFDYLAPEVRAGGEISPESDVFALGVLLHELVLGSRPYGMFTPPGEVLAKEGVRLAPELDRVIARALEHDAHARYADASIMLEDLLAGATGIASTRPKPKRVEGPNPLVVGLSKESFLDATIFASAAVLFWTLVPGAVLAALGFETALRVLLAVGGSIVGLTLAVSYARHALKVARLRARARRSLEESA